MSNVERTGERSGASPLWRQWFGRVTNVAVLLGFACLVFASDTWAGTLEESSSKLQLATEIQRGYVQSLSLRGKTAEQAIATMLAEGFRCKIEASDPFGLIHNPLSTCSKQPSGFGELCDKLEVTLDFDRLSGPASQEAMLGQLDTIKTKFATAFCPYPQTVSAEFVALRASAEAELSRHVASLDLAGSARAVFDRLLVGGYYCGFATGASIPVSEAQLVCTKAPTGIKFCFRSNLVMSVAWPVEVTRTEQLFGALPKAQVKAVRSTCELPAIKSDGRPP
jgi:hypothetical protein